MTTNFEPIFTSTNRNGELLELYRFENGYGASVAVPDPDSGVPANIAVLRYHGDGETDYAFVEDRTNNPVLAALSRDDEPTIDVISEAEVENTLGQISELNAEGYGEAGGVTQADLEAEVMLAMLADLFGAPLETEDDFDFGGLLGDAEEEV